MAALRHSAELAVMDRAGLCVSGCCGFECVEAANVNFDAIDVKFYFPISVSIVPAYALHAGRIGAWLPHVPFILGGSCKTKVAQAVVRLVSINMVNLDGRPNTMNKKPCQPMSGVVMGVDLDAPISICAHMPSYAPCAHSAPRYLPSKIARFRIIGQKLLDAVLRDNWDYGHGVFRSLWQVRAARTVPHPGFMPRAWREVNARAA